MYNNSTSLALAGEKMETLAILSSRLTSDKPISGGLHMLTQSRLKELLHYNPETGLFTWIKRTGSARAGRVAGIVNHYGYIHIKVDRKSYYAQRIVWLYVHGEFPDKDIDHINRDKKDNRLENLRLATRGENIMNRGIQKNNKSGYRGVHQCKVSKKWIAATRIDNKQTAIGRFDNKEDAFEAYKKVVTKKHPEFVDLSIYVRK